MLGGMLAQYYSDQKVYVGIGMNAINVILLVALKQ